MSIICNMSNDILEVLEVNAVSKNELAITFNNNIEKIVNLNSLIKNPPPVFIKLKDELQFQKVTVNMVGGVSWECGADLSADFLFSK
jgi:hypothetical protein